MKPYILTLLLCLSCTKYAKVSSDAMGVRIEEVEMNIQHIKEVEWKVGKWREDKVSQSFIFGVTLPKISQDELDQLQKNKGVDSWILRVIMMKGSERQDLGSLYTLFRPMRKSRGSSSTAATSASFKIYYAAAYASERFRNSKCPPFNHNKKIDEIEVVGKNEPFNITLTGTMPYHEKSQLIELTPSSFNGGHTLAAEYYIEIAAYNSHTKSIHSDFKRLPIHLEIKRENSIDVKTCAGIHPELER